MQPTTATPVRVSLPASVAADIGKLKSAIGTVLDRLGCPKCCSGHDIHLEIQRDWVLKGVRDIAKASGPMRIRATQRDVHTLEIGLAPTAAATIDDVFAAVDRIAELSGHAACATGCDMRFRLERILVLDERLQLEEMALRVG
jgi:hypothetical protein